MLSVYIHLPFYNTSTTYNTSSHAYNVNHTFENSLSCHTICSDRLFKLLGRFWIA